jgi:hypothetical protein
VLAITSAADAHRRAGLAAVTGEHYEGGAGWEALQSTWSRGVGAQASLGSNADPVDTPGAHALRRLPRAQDPRRLSSAGYSVLQRPSL